MSRKDRELEELITQFKDYVRDSLEVIIRGRIEEYVEEQKPSKLDLLKESSDDISELPCEMIDKIEDKMYFIIGDEYAEKYFPMASRLRYPPLFFGSSECKEELSKMGIKGEGIYLVKFGKVLEKVRKPKFKK